MRTHASGTNEIIHRRVQHLRDPEEAISEGLARIVTCDPLPARFDHDIPLVGPPGHGRTATAAKLTRRAAVARAEVLPVAADLDGTAGGDQLAAYLELERGQIRTCHSPDQLFDVLRKLKKDNRRCVIDLPAINPFDEGDMASLQDLISVIKAEPVLVMSAEGHPDDQMEAARGFARAGVKRAILTKLDVLDARNGIRLIEAAELAEEVAPDGAASGPERGERGVGTTVNELVTCDLVRVVMQQIPILREKGRVARRVVVGAGQGV